jgi:hypothetical protein
MKRNSLLPVAAVFLLAATSLFAAPTPRMVIEYFENNSGGLYVRAADGVETEAAGLSVGDELTVGSTLITLQGDYAELRLDPNGTIVRVSENTNFTVKSVQGRDGAARNAFGMAVGKVKTVAAKRKGAVYSFEGNTAACGVRGTKFIFSVLPGQRELAYVLEGVVDFSNQAGQTLALQAGMAADALAASFASFTPPPDLLQELESGTQFQKLSEEQVSKGETPPSGEAEGEAKGEGEGMAQAPEVKNKTPRWMQKLMDFLGMEIGTVTLPDLSSGENVTWAEAIIQPRFQIGKLKVGLYLPIIYHNDLFDPDDWYHPVINGEANDEWSFGTDQSGWDSVAVDLVNDIFLKIRYVEWGEQRDPFFFKFGNWGDLTLGHGSIMRHYANDLDFPAERKLGLNLGVNGKKGGLEAMISDAADPQLFGIRPYWKPGGGKLALGFTAMADLNPEQVPYGGAATYGKPVFLNGGLDMEYSILEGKRLSVVPYLDGAIMLPFFREPVAAYGVDSGFALDAVWNNGAPHNYGAMAGVLGNISFLDYRLEFRYADGIFQPAFYGPLYDRESPERVTQLLGYLADPAAENVRTLGVYGELGFTLERVLYISGGYYWPWPSNWDAEWVNDTLHLEFGILKGLLPLYGSIALDRVGIGAPLMRGDGLDFFDAGLRFSGEIVYPFSPLMELALQASTNVVGGSVYPTISIVTRING